MEQMLYDAYVNILREELIPAMGCTEPIAIAYAAALARETLAQLPEKVDIQVSANIIKNVKSVVVPHTGGLRGIEAAAAAGIVAGDSKAELEVISHVSEAQISQIAQYMHTAQFHVEQSNSGYVFDIQITLIAGQEEAFVQIAGGHTNVIGLRLNDKVLIDKEYTQGCQVEHTDHSLLTVENIIDFADCVRIEDVKETLDRQIACNTAIAEEGLSGKWGANIGSVLLAVLAWLGLLFFERPLLTFFGADEALLALAQRYLAPIKYVFPIFLFNQMLAAFLRNDGDPGLATLGVLSGGIFNVFGDYFFVFPCDMGIYGAGLATAIGSVVSFLVLMTHFLRRRNTLRLVRVERLPRKLWEITVSGFSSFFIDVAMGILTVLFNRQIMRCLGSDALAVYGPIINVSTFVQCCAYSVGQAAQPIISTNYGAGKGSRIRETLRLALYTTAAFALFWTALSFAAPNLYIRVFMSPTPEILAIAPAIIRVYALSFLLLPLNIFSTYYFQSIMQPRAALIVSVARGLVISGILILLLPVLTGPDSLWFAMPVTELLTAVYTAFAIRRYTKAL